MFNCTKCGLCCRQVGKFPFMKSFAKEDGSCIHLKNNLCDCYENRPEICNVDLMYEKYFSSKMTKDEWYALQEISCRKIRDDARISRSDQSQHQAKSDRED